MASLLKDVFNTAYYQLLAKALKKNLPGFREKTFLKQVFSEEWERKELKERMRHTTEILHPWMPGTFPEHCRFLLKTMQTLKEEKSAGLADLIFPDYIEVYGQNDPEISLDAMEIITQYISCEFAIRPFLIAHQEMVMQRMLQWSEHENYHVRRFSSEGCRPRLPWAMAIPALKKDPSPILPILENLKADESLFVRKSVANNLNDIAKDHPSIVKTVLVKWQHHSKETDWILKHGSRTLLKKGDPDALAFFGWGHQLKAEISGFKLSAKNTPIGGHLTFQFTVEILEKKKSRVRIEFAVHYVKSNGSTSRKIFQLAQQDMEPGKKYAFSKKISFKDLTTRKHYPGKHRIGIVLNGKETVALPFQLTEREDV